MVIKNKLAVRARKCNMCKAISQAATIHEPLPGYRRQLVFNVKQRALMLAYLRRGRDGCEAEIFTNGIICLLFIMFCSLRSPRYLNAAVLYMHVN